RSDNGQVTGYLGIAKDVTELKKAEEENKRLQNQILQSQKLDAVGQLAGGVAHDFNNILMGISGIASLMRMEHTPDDAAYSDLKSIEDYVERGAKLTKQLLGFARGGKYEPKVFSINDLITGSARFFTDAKKEIEVKFDLQQDLPPIEADEGQIEQVLLNLYINAGHAMPNGGTIHIESREIQLSNALTQSLDLKAGRYVFLSVSDNGIGMDEQTLQHIFEPFFTTRLAEGGSGLGLASAYGIIRNHGGAIEVSSVPENGSTFRIYLPASDKNTFRNDSTDNRNTPVHGSDGILIIDDEEMILKTASALLKRIGFTVFMAQTMEEAVSVYTVHRNDIRLIILDMILKGTSGAQVLTRLKNINPEVKVILSSGYGMEGEIRKVMDLGCQGFIQKPYKLSELSEIIAKILS
ncbi:MAG TPA: ATP-binding protein, partial [Spirochaetota bacterium]|nr:ATP-binding protein [Spirochaetota bacterium]